MVIVLEAQVALTPAGRPFAPETPAFDIPVAPVIVWVIFVKAEPMHKVGLEEAAPAVLTAETVRVPVAFTVPQPPVSGII